MNGGQTSSRLAAWYAPKQLGGLKWLETVLITSLCLLAAACFRPADPALLNQSFPWLWLAPVLLALRHGSLAGLLSALLLVADWVFLYDPELRPAAVPTVYFLGGTMLTLGAGQFADIWAGRLRRVREINHYLDERLEALTRSHYLLKHDHERLEQELLIKPVTLRHTLDNLRRLVVPREAQGSPLPRAQELLGILAQACQLEAACLYVEQDGIVQAEPAACLGDAPALDPRDPLFVLMQQTNQLCHVQTSALREAASDYLVVAPIHSAEGRRLGVLLVRRMPFLALNAESLQLLSVVLGYYADVISPPPAVNHLQRRLPDCPLSFAAELQRLDRVYRECRVASTLVALGIDAAVPQGDQVFGEVLRQQRHLDTNWPLRGHQRHILLTLMPLHGLASAQGYFQRLEQHVRTRFGISTMTTAGITLVTAPVGRQPIDRLLAGVLERCHAG